MKKLIDKRIICINSILLGIGVLFGIVLLIITSSLDKDIIKSEITDYFNLINTNNISLINLLNSFKTNILYISFICVLSCFYILSPLILLINFYKGMQIGFIISSIIMTYKLKGILYSILILFPHQLLLSALVIIYSSVMMNYSIKLFKATKDNKNLNISLFIKRISILFIGSLIICILCSILEIYFNPILMKLVL